jgi:hypothetical protein
MDMDMRRRHYTQAWNGTLIDEDDGWNRETSRKR